VSETTRALGAWIYLAVALLVFLETTALVGFVIHGELALLAAGVAASSAACATMPFVAGSSGMPLRLLVRVGVVSALVWTVTFTLLGYAFSDSFMRAARPRRASASSPSCSPPRPSCCARAGRADAHVGWTVVRRRSAVYVRCGDGDVTGPRRLGGGVGVR
jgi:hypothetical protein